MRERLKHWRCRVSLAMRDGALSEPPPGFSNRRSGAAEQQLDDADLDAAFGGRSGGGAGGDEEYVEVEDDEDLEAEEGQEGGGGDDSQDPFGLPDELSGEGGSRVDLMSQHCKISKRHLPLLNIYECFLLCSRPRSW